MRRPRLTRYREALARLGPLPVAAVLERLEAEGQLSPGWEARAEAALARPQLPWPARVFVELGAWGAVLLAVCGLAGDDLLHASGAEKLCGLTLCVAGIALGRVKGLLAGALGRALTTIGQLVFFIGIADTAAHVVPELSEAALVLELALLLAAENAFERVLSAGLFAVAALALAEWLWPGAGGSSAALALLLGVALLGHQGALLRTRAGAWVRPALAGVITAGTVGVAFATPEPITACLCATALGLAMWPTLRPGLARGPLLATALVLGAALLPGTTLLLAGLALSITGAHRRFPALLGLGVLAALGGAFQLELAQAGSLAGWMVLAAAIGLLLLRIGSAAERPSASPAPVTAPGR